MNVSASYPFNLTYFNSAHNAFSVILIIVMIKSIFKKKEKDINI